MVHYADTNNARHRQHTPLPNSGILILKSDGRAHFHQTGPLAHLFFVERAACGGKQSVKMKGPICNRRCNFAMYKFLSVRNTFSYDHVSKNMNVWSIHWVSHRKSYFQTFTFFDPPKSAQTKQRGPCPGTHVSKLGPQLPKGSHCDRKGGPEGAHSGFWREPKGPVPPGHPALSSYKFLITMVRPLARSGGSACQHHGGSCLVS